MKNQKTLSFFIVGLALFSMFFGAGNLIFPLYVGILSQTNPFLATLGFLTTAVALPFLGILIMVIFQGNYPKFFSILGSKIGSLIPAILLTVWIPLGSAPRCITLAHASVTSYISVCPLWVFSIFYCLIVYLVIKKKSRILEILGTFLTPLLLACLGLIFIIGINFFSLSGMKWEALDLYFVGMREGYNTMDMIAAFFFCASIINLLHTGDEEKSKSTRTTFKACLLGMSLLSLVYIGLIQLASQHALILQDVPKDQLLVQVAKIVLGKNLAIIAAIAIILACFTTSVALVVVFHDYLVKTALPWISKSKNAMVFTLVSTFCMSIFGLSGITKVTSPVLQVFYPFLLFLIVVQLINLFLQKWVFRKKGEVLTDS